MIHEARRVEFPVVDLRGLSEAEQAARLRRLRAEEAERPFDLGCDLLLRALLLVLGNTEHVVLLTTHHIASDGWSVEVFARRSPASIAPSSAAAATPCMPLPIQYADFAVVATRAG